MTRFISTLRRPIARTFLLTLLLILITGLVLIILNVTSNAERAKVCYRLNAAIGDEILLVKDSWDQQTERCAFFHNFIWKLHNSWTIYPVLMIRESLERSWQVDFEKCFGQKVGLSLHPILGKSFHEIGPSGSNFMFEYKICIYVSRPFKRYPCHLNWFYGEKKNSTSSKMGHFCLGIISSKM